MLKINQILNLTIEKLSQGSGGIGYSESKAIFVPYTIPGDQVKVRIVEVKKKYGRGQLLEVVTPSSKRVSPPCSVFGKCGGCQWQMLSYQDQLCFKQEFLQRQVQYLSQKQNESVALMPIVESPQPLRYRRRLRLKTSGQEVGYFADSSHKFIAIEDCLVGEEGLVSYLREHIASKETSKLKTIEVDKNPVSLKYSVRDLDVSDPGFTQVNPAVNQLLVKAVGSWVQDLNLPDSANVLELFCGQGNLTFDLIHHLPSNSQIMAVEINEEAIIEAKARLEKLPSLKEKIVFVQCDAKEFLLNNQFNSYSIILIDPPRVGLSSEMMDQILKISQAKYLLYISCNLATWGRDAKLLVESSKWKLNKAQAFDMFPQTDHFEILSLFSMNV
jgi:23S rRNA (uracil1939-C5)-methyltransferase